LNATQAEWKAEQRESSQHGSPDPTEAAVQG
jgi:hypothetical protein